MQKKLITTTPEEEERRKERAILTRQKQTYKERLITAEDSAKTMIQQQIDYLTEQIRRLDGNG